MKKCIIAIAAFALAAASASAQDISVAAGYLNSHAKTSVKNSSTKTIGNGFYAGVNADCFFSKYVGVSSGIYYSFITQNSESELLVVKGKTQTNEHYLTIPLHAMTKYNIGNGMTVFASAGPAVNIGLASSSRITGSIDGIGSNEKTVNNYGDDSNYGRFDVLLGAKAGVEFSDFRVYVGYNYGLLDRNTSDNAIMHRSECLAGVAFVF